METILIDSPVANVANIARALRACDATLRVTADPAVIASARQLVLPGVGSFVAAMRWLTENAIDRAIHQALAGGASLLGICVGHQLLFDRSHEMGITPGLGLLRGEIVKFAGVLPVPQIGWNRVETRVETPVETMDQEPSGLFRGIPSGTPFYFVNSYAATGVASEIGRADYGGSFTAAAHEGRVSGLQFHPEKSSSAGLRVLRNYVEGAR